MKRGVVFVRVPCLKLQLRATRKSIGMGRTRYGEYISCIFIYTISVHIFTLRAYALAGLSDCFCLSVRDKTAL